MKIGLIGFAKSGKTTVFNALTGNNAVVDKYVSAHQEPHIGVVQVMDERVTQLSEMYNPKKTIYAQFEYYDFPPLFGSREESGSNDWMSDVKAMEGYVLILRNFSEGEMDALYGAPDAVLDLSRFEEEMLLHDMVIAEKRLEKIELGYKRGIKTPAIQLEEKVLHHIHQSVSEGIPVRSLTFTPDEEKSIRGFQFMSQKPLLVLLNCGEDNLGTAEEQLSQIRSKGYLCQAIAGRFEEELSSMEEEDAKVFMEDMGISESVRDRLTHLCFQLMGYLSFFTVGPDEVRAWTITKGDNAVTAAGKIHSDLARGFIRAECFSYDDLIRLGSEKALREKGLFRLEGKEYTVKDGDILSIRFNV